MTDYKDAAPASPGAAACARLIDDAFATYNFHFRTVTQRAARRFRDRDWHGSQRDAVQRIELYDRAVRRTVRLLAGELDEKASDRDFWIDIKRHYARRIRNFLDRAFHETFFNSVTRKLFNTVGVDADVEFTKAQPLPEHVTNNSGFVRRFEFHGSFWQLLERGLSELNLDVPWADLASSLDIAAARLAQCCDAMGGRQNLQALELMRPIFYRDYRAYVIGRLITKDSVAPVVIAIDHGDAGLEIDGVVTTTDDLSILFGFARSYIHVDLEPVFDAVLFLKDLLPKKPISELYTALGRAKQGKTERFRTLVRHLTDTGDRFIDAAFDKGMVMIVFTPQKLPVILKVIRDKFASSKEVVRKDVLDRYRLVFTHDRAGRLVDAQEFRDLKFHRSSFSAEVIDELLKEASQTVRVEGDDIILEHVYIERRLTPLNQFLLEADQHDRMRAVLDYGRALRDLAASNIFPGDLLLKNFGVTRHCRVIFYDYDELCLVTDCNFRDFPKARTDEEEMSSEEWFYVADNDVFPEQFMNFLGLDQTMQEAFMDSHGELLTAHYWRQMQQKINQGEVFEILPYTRVT